MVNQHESPFYDEDATACQRAHKRIVESFPIDLGAWHGYYLPKQGEDRLLGGFAGPVIIAEEYPVNLSRAISRIKIVDETGKKYQLITSAKSFPIVSTDAVYRQTFWKEQLWREKGAVGVDMETSALFSVGSFLGLDVVSVLIASDKHPLREEDPAWAWTMTQETRHQFFEQVLQFVRKL